MSVYLIRFSRSFWRSEATVAGVFDRFGVSFVSSVLAGDRYHNGLFVVWEYMFVLIWPGLTYNTDFCTYGRRKVTHPSRFRMFQAELDRWELLPHLVWLE